MVAAERSAEGAAGVTKRDFEASGEGWPLEDRKDEGRTWDGRERVMPGARDLAFAAEGAGRPDETRRGRRTPSWAAELEFAAEEAEAETEALVVVKVLLFGIPKTKEKEREERD